MLGPVLAVEDTSGSEVTLQTLTVSLGDKLFNEELQMCSR